MRHYIWDAIGFVEAVDRMGSDESIENAARVSYSGGGTRTTRDREALIDYLVRHQHSSPLEMCELVLHLKLPIFVARQLVRHRTASLNEISARYSVLPTEYYTPAPEHLAKQSTTNKQGRGEQLESPDIALNWIREAESNSFETYQDLLACDLSRELARIPLPLGTYTEMVWKMDLRNLLNFLKLRLDTHAQYEIRIYAEIIAQIVKDWVPITYAAFERHVLNAYTLSEPMLLVVRRMLSGETVTQENSGLRARDWAELTTKLGVAP